MKPLHRWSMLIKASLWLCCWQLAGTELSAQQQCFQLRFSTENASPGDTIAVKVRVRDFKGIESYQCAVKWNPADLKYIKHVSAGATLPGQLFGAGTAAQGLFRAIWADPNAASVTLPDDARLFTLYFQVLNPAPGFYPVDLLPDEPVTIYEVADLNANRMPLACVAGGARVGSLSSLTFDALCVEFGGCAGASGNITTDISGGLMPYHFQWTGPSAFQSTDSVLYNLQGGFYYLTITDAKGDQIQAQAGMLQFPGFIYLSGESTKNATCNLADGCANVTTSGGTGPYIYSWTDGGSQESARCDLPAGVYGVSVTDFRGCVATTSLSVQKDSSLALDADSLNADCRFKQKGGIQLYCNSAAPCHYEWSNGASTQNLSDLDPGTYTVTATDDNGCRNTRSVMVEDYGTFDWFFNMDYKTVYQEISPYYSIPKTNLTLKAYDFAVRAEFPLTLSWTNGTRQNVETLGNDQFYETLGEVDMLPNGYYQVTIMDAQGCSATVNAYPNEPAPYLIGANPELPSFYIRDKDSGPLDSCVEVYAMHSYHLKNVDFGIKWSPYHLQLKEVKPENNQITLDNFTFNSNSLDFHWESQAPYPLNNYFTLFKVCFQPLSEYETFVEFTHGSQAPRIVDELYGEMGFIGKNGKVNFKPNNQTYEPFNEVNLVPPACGADGYARIEYASNFSTISALNNLSGTFDHKYFFGPEPILFAKPGEYTLGQTISGTTSSLYAYIPPYEPPSSDCVWPGDASNDNVVNQFDLLYLALGMGKHFEPRNEQDSLWKGLDAPDWPEQTPRRHINFKHCDLDGNGWIEPADTSVIYRQWENEINTNDYPTPYRLPYPPDSLATAWAIDIQADTLDAGKMLSIPVYATAENILGMAFSISYDSVLVVSEVSFEPVPGWLGDPQNDLISVQKDFQHQSRFDLALARVGTAATGAGLIGHLNLRFTALPPDSLVKTMLFTSHGLAITPEETLIALPETRKAVFLKGGIVNGTQNPQEWPIEIYPNPVADMLHVDIGDKTLNRLEILTSTGQRVEGLELKDLGNQAGIDVSRLPVGAYWLRGYVGDSFFTRFFVIAR